MPVPHNPFKAAITKGQLQLGCWLGLADPYIAEISAGAGFDFRNLAFMRQFPV